MSNDKVLWAACDSDYEEPNTIEVLYPEYDIYQCCEGTYDYTALLPSQRLGLKAGECVEVCITRKEELDKEEDL